MCIYIYSVPKIRPRISAGYKKQYKRQHKHILVFDSLKVPKTDHLRLLISDLF